MFEPIKLVIDRVANKKNLRGEFLSAHIGKKYILLAQDVFPEKNINQILKPKFFKNGILYLAVTANVYSQELRLAEKEILKNLQEYFPQTKIQKIHFQVENFDF